MVKKRLKQIMIEEAKWDAMTEDEKRKTLKNKKRVGRVVMGAIGLSRCERKKKIRVVPVYSKLP